MLAVSISRLMEVDPDATIFIANDARDRASVPAGCREAVTHYERGGTGMGLAAVEGEILTMQHILSSTGENYCVKLDSDVWINSVDELRVEQSNADFLGLETANMLLPTGCAYRLSKLGADTVLNDLRKRWEDGAWNPAAAYSENLTIFHLACLSPKLSVELIPYHLGKLVGMHDDGNIDRALKAAVVHCGERLSNGQRAAREHVFCRMALIKSETTNRK